MLNRRVCQLALHANIEVEYVQTVIRRNRIRPESPEIENWPWPVKVRTLGTFRVDLDGKPLISGRKVQRKPLELLKALVAFGGNGVSAESLGQALWPDAKGDTACGALGMALARLRKLLTHDDALALSGNKLTLDPHCCSVDVWALERVFEQADTLQTDSSSIGVLESLTERILGLYAGDFLANETEQPWMLPLRDRLRARVLRHVLALGQQLEQTQRYGQAMALYQRGLEHDNLAEPVYRRLMFCHYRLGHQAEAMAVYRRCREMLSVVLGVKPAVETEKLYHDVRRG